MKTLDEVIDAMERCSKTNCFDCNGCPYEDDDAEVGCRSDDKDADALHYLKEYQQTVKWIEIEAEQFEQTCEFIRKATANDPLTWDELQKMEGKPVWVEILSDEIDLSSRWMMVARETKAHSLPLAYTDDMGHWIYGHEDDLGKTWQAYRKERG